MRVTCYAEPHMNPRWSGLLGLVGMGALAAITTGCGPGLSHHGAFAARSASSEAPATEAVGTTTITSQPLVGPLRLTITKVPAPILPAINWDDDVDEDGNLVHATYSPYPGLQTWGEAPKVLTPEEKYGF